MNEWKGCFSLTGLFVIVTLRKSISVHYMTILSLSENILSLFLFQGLCIKREWKVGVSYLGLLAFIVGVVYFFDGRQDLLSCTSQVVGSV